MIKKFNELADGTKFTYNGVEYEKIKAVKISCCKSINAKATANEKQRIFLAPNTEVTINS
jgi:hypothetical protein